MPLALHGRIRNMQQNMRRCFDPDYPIIVNHMNLDGTNIILNENGNINGIIDWAEAEYSPFGFSFYGLENILGWHDLQAGVWRHVSNHRALRKHFVDLILHFIGVERGSEMSDRIMVANQVGLLLRYGVDSKTNAAVQVGSPEYQILEYFVNQLDDPDVE